MTVPICTTCNEPAEEIGHELFECEHCGRLIDNHEHINDNKVSSVVSFTDLSGRRHRIGTKNSEYRTIQIRHNRAVLCTYNDKYQGKRLPLDVLDEAAKNYSIIQQMYSSIVKRDLVRRGTIKRMILVSLIYHALVKRGLARKKTELAEIFDLADVGFGDGDSQVRELNMRLSLDLVSDGSIENDYAKRYLKGLGLYSPESMSFVTKMLAMANSESIGIHCFLSSRVTGAIYIYMRELGLKYSNDTIAKACDSCKKSTFDKFCTIIENNLIYFKDIINELRIRHGSNLLTDEDCKPTCMI